MKRPAARASRTSESLQEPLSGGRWHQLRHQSPPLLALPCAVWGAATRQGDSVQTWRLVDCTRYPTTEVEKVVCTDSAAVCLSPHSTGFCGVWDDDMRRPARNILKSHTRSTWLVSTTKQNGFVIWLSYKLQTKRQRRCQILKPRTKATRPEAEDRGQPIDQCFCQRLRDATRFEWRGDMLATHARTDP